MTFYFISDFNVWVNDADDKAYRTDVGHPGETDYGNKIKAWFIVGMCFWGLVLVLAICDLIY